MATTTIKPRRETLKTRIAKIKRGDRGAWWALAGCPVGGWAETEQARRRICEDLPFRAERSYTLDDLIGALYCVDRADRYRPR